MQKKIKIEQVNPRMNLRWADRWEPGHVEQIRYLYDHEMVVFLAGASRVVVGDQAFTCSKGDALIIPPGIRLWTRAMDGVVERCCCHFDSVHGGAEVNPPFVYEAADKFVHRRCKPAPKWLKVRMPLCATGIPLQRLLPLLRALACDRSPVGLLRQLVHIASRNLLAEGQRTVFCAQRILKNVQRIPCTIKIVFTDCVKDRIT